MIARKVYILLFLIVFRIQFCFAQYVAVPDANFRSFLQANFSSVMTGPIATPLDTVLAANVTGNLNCRLKSISNISGIQYFKKISIINISNNNITNIPPLKNFVNPLKLFCDTNALTSLPALTGLSTLQGLSCKKNNLNSLPALTGLSNLSFLSCGFNNLTSLPSLNGLTALLTLDCSENQLTQLPDLSSLINLENLYCAKNNLTIIPSVSNLHYLQYFVCPNNQLTSLPDLSNCPALKYIKISGNKITQLPNLSFLNPSLITVSLDYNNLTFEDLLPVVNNSNYSVAFVLFPQNKAGSYADTLIKKSGTYKFNSGIDGAVSTNTYKWFKSGNPIAISTTTTNSFSIANVALTDTGNYYVVIKNSHPSFLNDSIISNFKKLKVTDCFSSSAISYSSASISCKEGFRVTIDASAASGGISPFTYEITNATNGEVIQSSTPVLSGIKEGSYVLTVKDVAGCETTPVFAELASIGDCDPVFSPNGDGVADTYYVSAPGKARIFNKNGTLVHEFSTPAYWDGLDKSGAEVPSGYYAIIVNEKITMNVSLMR
jgi:internalin A